MYSVIVIASGKVDAFKRFRDKSIVVLALACLVGRGWVWQATSAR